MFTFYVCSDGLEMRNSNIHGVRYNPAEWLSKLSDRVTETPLGAKGNIPDYWRVNGILFLSYHHPSPWPHTVVGSIHRSGRYYSATVMPTGRVVTVEMTRHGPS